jgi:hypothetical protein
MKRYLLFMTALLVLAGGSSARAVDLLSDNFDSYADQAAFVAAWPRYEFGSVTSDAQLVQDEADSPPNSVFNAGTLTNAQQRNMRHFDQLGFSEPTDKIVWSFDFFDSAPAASPSRNHANFHDQISDEDVHAAPVATNQLISMGLHNNQTAGNSGGNRYMARILGYTPFTTTDPEGGPAESVAAAGSFFKLNDYPEAPLRSAGWHNLKVEMTLNEELRVVYDFFVDNILSETVEMTTGSLRNWDTVVLGSGLSNASTSAYFDNVLVQLNPPEAPPVNADFNGDGTIDAADYVAWKKFNPRASGATPAMGDADGDGDNDDTDYALWQENFAEASPGSGGGGAVPEPSTISLMLLGMAAMMGRRRG